MSSPHTEPSPPKRSKFLSGSALGFVALAAGVALIAGMASLEVRENEDVPWANLLISTDAEAPWPGTIEVSARRIDNRNYPAQETAAKAIRGSDLADSYKAMLLEAVELTERILFIDMPAEDLAPILESGELPTPGEYEVLAGVNCRLDEFELGNRRFHVTGRIRRDIPGLSFAYLLPYETHMGRLFQSNTETTKGWLDTEGRGKLLALPPDDRGLEDSPLIAPLAPTTPFVSWGVLVGLMLVAAGGAALQVRLFLAMAGRATGPLRPIISAITDRSFLLSVVHILLYGLFFVGMAAGIRSPVDQTRVQNFVVQQFEDGELSHITDAFESGEIPRTAWAIFANNYGKAALRTILLPSCVIPYAGALICAGIFSFTGFGMAPVWTGIAAPYTYHSITMTLELEAYVIAAFVVCLLPILVVRGIIQQRFLQGVGEAARALASVALLTGIMLAIAAVYEAATLITLQ